MVRSLRARTRTHSYTGRQTAHTAKDKLYTRATHHTLFVNQKKRGKRPESYDEKKREKEREIKREEKNGTGERAQETMQWRRQ